MADQDETASSPATPHEGQETSVTEETLTVSIAQTSLHEPSPASTYGETAPENSVPPTPEAPSEGPSDEAASKPNMRKSLAASAASQKGLIQGNQPEDPFVEKPKRQPLQIDNKKITRRSQFWETVMGESKTDASASTGSAGAIAPNTTASDPMNAKNVLQTLDEKTEEAIPFSPSTNTQDLAATKDVFVEHQKVKRVADSATAPGYQTPRADMLDRVQPVSPEGGAVIRSVEDTSIHQGPIEPIFDDEDGPRQQITEPISADNAQSLLPPKACVFVANLSSTETDIELTHAVSTVFGRFGRVWVKIRRDNAGMPYAFCQYANEREARVAIAEGRQQMINGRPCRTEPAKVNRSVYMSRLAGGAISEAEAREALQNFGPIESLWWPTPTEKAMYQLPEGIWIKFGYFQDCRDVQTAFRGNETFRVEQPSILESHRSVTRDANYQFRPRFQQPGFRREADGRSLFIGNLPPTANRERISQIFRPYGQIRFVDVITKRSPQGKGFRHFAFIGFTSHEDSVRAIQGQNGQSFDGRTIRVQQKESNEAGFRNVLGPSEPPTTPQEPGPVQSEMSNNNALLEQQRQVLAFQSWQIEQGPGAHGNMTLPYGAPSYMQSVPPMSPFSGPPTPQHPPYPVFGYAPNGGPSIGNGVGPQTPTHAAYPLVGQNAFGFNQPSLAAQLPEGTNLQGLGMYPPYQPVPPTGQYQYPVPYYQMGVYNYPTMPYGPNPMGPTMVPGPSPTSQIHAQNGTEYSVAESQAPGDESARTPVAQ
ncbi:MAG: hypothetical protein M1837_007182 [Sclerophora amabilis]|nr:MAG: hypothetical protein M1837_007182 [Sclerophora amabilis]